MNLCSVVITNYNYARFLREAIDSVLAQSYPHIEVVIVDDASTDGSREVICSYGHSVSGVLQEANGGMASAINAGFEKTRGEVIIFLDADDVLFADTVGRVMEAFGECPKIAKVHYRLEVVDASSKPVGAFVPPKHRILPDGDMRELVLQAPDDLMFPPTSGNAFARWALHRLLPMPLSYRKYAENYLLNGVPLLGLVRSLHNVGGAYRVHGGNDAPGYARKLNIDRVRESLEAKLATHQHILQLAHSIDPSLTTTARNSIPSVLFSAESIVWLRLRNRDEPLRDQRVIDTAVDGLGAAWRNYEFRMPVRLAVMAWFGLMATSPTPLARWLAERFLCAASRPRLTRLVGYLSKWQRSRNDS